MTGIQIDISEVMALVHDSVEDLQISIDAKVSAIIAAGTTTAVQDGGDFNDVLKVAKRIFQIRTDLNMEILKQIEVIEAAAAKAAV